MNKRTWKRKSLSDDRIREALKAAGGNAAAAAEQLGVHRSSLSRWIKADPTLVPHSTRKTSAAVQASDNMSPEEWRSWILATFELDGVELQLLDLAVESLSMVRDLLLKPGERLAAMSRFQSLVRQLNFPDPEANDETETSEPTRPQLRVIK